MTVRWASLQFLDDPEFKHPWHPISGNKSHSISSTLPTSSCSFLAHLKTIFGYCSFIPDLSTSGLIWAQVRGWKLLVFESIWTYPTTDGTRAGWWEKGPPQHGKVHGLVTRMPSIKGAVIVLRTCFLNCMRGVGYEWKMKGAYEIKTLQNSGHK